MAEKALIAGGTGLVGSRLVDHLESGGYQVCVLTRNDQLAQQSPKHLHWDIAAKQIDNEALDVDHVINLCGAGIADGRWTESRKRLLIESRVGPTDFLIESFTRAGKQLKSYVSASAVGYYGDRGETMCDETTSAQDGSFLSEVCQLWEAAAFNATSITDQVSIVRIGVVLAADGGALEKIAQTIPYGLASYIGSGGQYMSWIHIDDLCRQLVHTLGLRGQGVSIYNAVAPHPVTNKALTKAAQEALNKKSLLMPAPAFAIKTLLGEMSAVVLDSTRVSCEKVLGTGFSFTYEHVDDALAEIYSKS